MKITYRTAALLIAFTALACSNKVELDEIQIHIWQPEGQDYFSNASNVELEILTEQGLVHRSETDVLENLNFDFTALASKDTPLDFTLTVRNSVETYVGYVDQHSLVWPQDNETPIQNNALMFLGPRNQVVSLTNGYPPSLTTTMTCQTNQGALVLGSSVSQGATAPMDTYFMNLDERTVKVGPQIATHATNSRCTLDQDNFLYIYGGCTDDIPNGGLMKTALDSNATLELLVNSNERNSCNNDILAVASKLWLIDGATIELRQQDGTLVSQKELSHEGPFYIAHGAPLSSEAVWVWTKNITAASPLSYLIHDATDWTVNPIAISGELLQVANNAASQSHALTTEGLFQLSLSEPRN